MRNLVRYPKSSIDFFRYTANRKEDHDLINRLLAIEAALEAQYLIYDNHCIPNRLELLTPNKAFEAIKADIHSLYEYNSVALRLLRKAIEDQQPRSVRYICQNCTLTSNESFDHFIPKEEFPEYSIHCTNLIPSCKTCNGYKSSVWKVKGKIPFINHYFDLIPNEQFLFVEIIEEENDEFNFRFYLENRSNIPREAFTKLESHYERLRLPERMRKRSVTVISELENMVSTCLEKISLEETVETVISTANKNKSAYGNNYWKSILEIALIQNDAFLKRLMP